MELKHTPGPWFVSPKTDVTVEGDLNVIQTHGSNVKGYHVAYCASWKDDKETAEEAEANARLMAAAPELLEALQEIYADYKALADSGDAGFWKVEDLPCGIKAINAIAKATGH